MCGFSISCPSKYATHGQNSLPTLEGLESLSMSIKITYVLVSLYCMRKPRCPGHLSVVTTGYWGTSQASIWPAVWPESPGPQDSPGMEKGDRKAASTGSGSWGGGGGCGGGSWSRCGSSRFSTGTFPFSMLSCLPF